MKTTKKIFMLSRSKKTIKCVKLLLLAFSVFILNACEPEKTGNAENGDNSTISGDVTENVTLKSGETYKLSGEYRVKNGAALTIEEGVTIVAIDDDIVDYILIEQGGKIIAQGTASNPIVMTSEKKEYGAWGGLHICGYASTNVEGGTGNSEIGNAVYGGNNDNDNSGIIRYVRIEYSGYAFDEERESNGFTFYGVGRETTAEYLETYMGSDDGFEFFGGTVNIRYAIAKNCSDDSFDWTEGWRGKAQFIVAYQENSTTLGYDCDCLFECDNNGNNFAATPTAHPIIANATLIGNNSADGKMGIRLRAGTEVEIYNSIIMGKSQPLIVETNETETALFNSSSVLKYIALSGELKSTENIFTNEMFIALEGNTVNNNFSLNGIVGTINGAFALTDSFFIATDYSGAISSGNNWTSVWAK